MNNATQTAATTLNKIRGNRGASYLFSDIVAGSDRVFYMTDRPTGWPLLSRLGVVEQVEGTDRARLTEYGQAVADVLTGRANRGTGRMDPSIRRRQEEEIIHDRRVRF